MRRGTDTRLSSANLRAIPSSLGPLLSICGQVELWTEAADQLPNDSSSATGRGEGEL